MLKSDLRILAKNIHEAVKAKGFWDKPRNMGELFMLIISEAAEMLESHRSGKIAPKVMIDESKRIIEEMKAGFVEGKGYEMAHVIVYSNHFQDHIKDTIQDELADILIRLLDFVGRYEDIKIYDRAKRFDKVPENVGEALFGLTEKIILVKKRYDQAIVDGTGTSLDRLSKAVNRCLWSIISIAQKLDIDLEYHVEAKMLFNKTRDRFHGKNY